MDFTDSYDMQRFRGAVEASRQKLQPFRENRLDMIEQFIGTHYGEEGPHEPVPIMFIEMAVMIYTYNLIGGEPQALVRTKHSQLKPTSQDLGIALNYVGGELELEDTLLNIVQDALISPIGIVKMGLTEAGEKEWWHEDWEPFVDRVDLDDWVHDTTATAWKECQFMGHRYRVPLADAKANEEFDAKERAKLVATIRNTINEEGDEKASSVSGDSILDEDEIEDMVELWEYWIPRQGVIITLTGPDQGQVGVLKVQKWKGPAMGPYRILGFNPVPSNLLPLPPAAVWRELHDLANSLYRKLGRQANRQKSVLPVQGGNEDDIKLLRDSKDGDVIRLDGQPSKEVSYGGPSQVGLAFFLSNMNIANRQAGNLDTLGGLRSSADTLGQEQLMQGQAEGQITYMRRRVNKFIASVFDGLAYYLFKDPFVSLSLEKQGPDPMTAIPIFWGKNVKEDDYRKFNITIDVHSTLPTTPQIQLQKMLSIIKEIIFPFAPLLQQQGVQIKAEALLKKVAEYADLPEIADFIYMEGPPQTYERGPVGSPKSGGGATSHTSERISHPGPGGEGGDTNLAQMLLGKAPQTAEMPGLSL